MEKIKTVVTKFWVMLVLLIPVAGYADIVVVVNPNNPIDQLQEDDIKRIFLGRVGAFPKTGQPMKVLDQTRDSEAYKKFYEDVIGFQIRHLKRYRAAHIFSGRGVVPEISGKNSEVKTKVLSDIHAIGYLDADYVDESLKVVFSHQ